ncbi:MAG TPA: nuclear transport factor 2 family protein [Acidimicrobiales bacterium]
MTGPAAGPAGAAASPSDEQLAIGQVLARYCLYLDRQDIDGWVGLFTSDGVYEVYGRTWEGHDGLRAMAEAAPPGLHLGGVPVIELTGPGRATAHRNLLFVPLDDQPHRRALYTDDLVKTDAGWRIRRCRCQFLTAAGLADRPDR